MHVSAKCCEVYGTKLSARTEEALFYCHNLARNAMKLVSARVCVCVLSVLLALLANGFVTSKTKRKEDVR